jgi:hypothetical protein
MKRTSFTTTSGIGRRLLAQAVAAGQVVTAVIFVLVLRPLRQKPASSTTEGGSRLDT